MTVGNNQQTATFVNLGVFSWVITDDKIAVPKYITVVVIAAALGD